MAAPGGVTGTGMVNWLIQYGIQRERSVLTKADALKHTELQGELHSLCTQLSTSHDDRIARRNEAIMVAESLGIEKPSAPCDALQKRRSDKFTGPSIVRIEAGFRLLA